MAALSTNPIQKSDKILIVGAGCFGISTAYHLLKRGYLNVTVIDRADTLPAPDAASTDINKVVRSSYSDEVYTKLTREAIALWKSEPFFGNTYHECGVLTLKRDSSNPGGVAYTDAAYENDVRHGCRTRLLQPPDELRSAFPRDIELGPFLDTTIGYYNYDGGWAFAAQGVAQLMAEVVKLGGTVVPGKEVVELLRMEGDGRTEGVRCKDGWEFAGAAVVVLAMGSWGASSLPQLKLEEKFIATGQTVATIQLTLEEASRYRDCPVILDFTTEFYMFPPNADNIVKFATHDAGYTRTLARDSAYPPVSTPRTTASHGPADGLRIPAARVRVLRAHLAQLYPELARKPFASTRLCWYTDTLDADWVIGYHPFDSGILFATAGSGHAFKFLPVIGRLVADAMEGVLEGGLAQRFAFGRSVGGRERANRVVEELDEDSLCAPEDLLL